MTLRLRGSTSGYAEINAPAVAGDNSLTLPTTTGTIRITNPSGVDGDYTVATGATITGSSNTIRFDTGANPPVQMDSNGHVGIGTNNNTTAALDVHGDIRISRGGRGDGTGKIMFGSDSGDYLQLQDIGTGGNIFELVQDGSKKVVVRGTNGNLGIGTDNPTSKLHINGTVRSNEGYTVYPPSDSNYAFATRNAADDQWTAFIEANGRATFAGNVVFSTSGSGIDFSATGDGSGTTTSELLDDYEEGTFTPTLRDNSNGSGTAATVGTAVGVYTKIGRFCNMSIRISSITSTTGMTSGNALFIGGLPFSIKSVTSETIYVGSCGLSNFNVDSGTYNVVAFINASSSDQTDIRLFENIDSGGHSSIKVSAAIPAANCELFINVTVPVA